MYNEMTKLITRYSLLGWLTLVLGALSSSTGFADNGTKDIPEIIPYRISMPDNPCATFKPGFIFGGKTKVVEYNTLGERLTTSQPRGGTNQYTHQWQISEDNTIWTDIDGATGQDYFIEVVQSSAYFRKLVMSGSCWGYTDTTQIIVSAAGYMQLSQNVFVEENVGIGTQKTAGYALSVNGKVRADEDIKVYPEANWADYVFESDYELKTPDELAAYLEHNKHLPGIPPASEVETSGIALGAMDARLLEKVEELTLYVIRLQKQNKMLRKKVQGLKNRSVVPGSAVTETKEYKKDKGR